MSHNKCAIILIYVLTRLSNGHVYHRYLFEFNFTYWIFHECRGWLVCGYLIFCEVLRPESDVVSNICINHALILSHFSRGMDGRGGGSYVVVFSTNVHAEQNGSFLAATKQLYEWYFLSVCLSVRLSVCLSIRHTFLTLFPSSYHHEIFRSYHQGSG